MSGERSTAGGSRPLSLEEYKRYGRQMIMPGWGLEGQVKVKAAKVAVVGAGGLGCPLLQYLAGAGVGTIGIFDHDEVDVSNLHRQVLHSSRSVGRNKAESAAEACRALNPHIEILPHAEAIDQHNAIELLESFDIVVDCTDRPLTRYLLSDASVLLSKTLVSGAAISTVGQWAVYGGISGKGKQRACYRCMWPSIIGDGGGRCDELGVWGSTVGLVGVAMAGEVLKVILGQDGDPLLHLYNQSGDPLVRTIKVRPPSAKCIACGPNRTITSLADFDYVSFCSGPKAESSSAETSCKRINPKDLDELLRGESDNRVVIDTRPLVEYGICSLPNTINMPFADILKKPEEVPTANEVYFVCRRGNDSLVAANALRVHFDKSGKNGPTVSDVRGGLVAWSKEVDPEFPVY